MDDAPVSANLPPSANERGDADTFECFDNWLSRWTCDQILAGQTYPQLPAIGDVRTVVDVGANCGAATVYFAKCYPTAVVHALEPAAAAFAMLGRNTRLLPNVRLHNIGLQATDERVPLYAGAVDAITASIYQREGKNTAESEMVDLRASGRWLAEEGISQIDVLKIDAEGCELAILEHLVDVLPTVKVLYVEYDTTSARRRIDMLLEPTHELCSAMMFLDQGEMIYVSRRVLDADPTAEAAIIAHFRDRLVADLDLSASSTRKDSARGDLDV